MATIQGVYVALFGRPADPTGLAYFNSVTKNGADLSGIGDLASTQEYKDRFAGQSNTQIVTAIYQSLFNRAPETAGLAFFVDALNKGTMNVKNIAINILDGAQGDDKTIVTNKITAADNFTKAIDTPIEVGSYQGNNAAQLGRNFLTPVGKDAATIPSTAATDAALKAIVDATPGSTGTAGVIINVTAANEQVNPAAANPAFKSTAGDDTVNIASSTINSSTNIDTGAGVDSLVIKGTGANGAGYVGGAGANAVVVANDQGGKPTLAGVEKISVTFTGGNGSNAEVGGAVTAAGTAGANFKLDLSGSTGVKEIWNDTSLAGTAGNANANLAPGGAAGDTVTFDKVALGTVVGIKGDTTANTVFNFAGATGNSDSATLNLKAVNGAAAATAKTATLNGIETVNVAVDGTSKVIIADNTLDKIVVTGTGDLNASTGATTLKTVDASALNGALTFTVSSAGAANGVSVTGTKLADTINFNATDASSDTIVYNSANKSTIGLVDNYTGVVWKTAGVAEDKIDVKGFNLGASTAVTTFTLTNANTVAGDGTSFGGNKVAVSTVGGTSYVYFDLDGNNKFDAASDLAFKVNNVTGFDKDNVIWS